MCNAFACIVTRAGQVYWHTGMDSHDAIYSVFAAQDTQLRNEALRSSVKVEITPNKGYLWPDDGWTLTICENGTPDWWTVNHESAAWRAHKEWRAEVYSNINLEEARQPINPFMLPIPDVTPQHLEWLKQWTSAGYSKWNIVGAFVKGSAGCSVGDSIVASVGDGVWDSVGNLLWHCTEASPFDNLRASARAMLNVSTSDSMWAYIGSLFDIWPADSPCQAAVNLWRAGLVPSFDGTTWRLHAGRDAGIVWEGAA